MGQNTKVDFSWERPPKSIINDKVLRNGATLKFAAVTWHKLYDPFVPMDTGLLAHDAIDYLVEGDAGIIHHKAPYASRIYYGEGYRFSKEKHPLASAQWDKAAIAAGKDKDLMESVQNYINRGS
jgi:hypothetical protein